MPMLMLQWLAAVAAQALTGVIRGAGAAVSLAVAAVLALVLAAVVRARREP